MLNKRKKNLNISTGKEYAVYFDKIIFFFCIMHMKAKIDALYAI